MLVLYFVDLPNYKLPCYSSLIVNDFQPQKHFDKNYSQPVNCRICLKFYCLKFVSNLRLTGGISAGFVSVVKSKFYQQNTARFRDVSSYGKHHMTFRRLFFNSIKIYFTSKIQQQNVQIKLIAKPTSRITSGFILLVQSKFYWKINDRIYFTPKT